MHALFSLEGQTALVTGSGSAEGIGFAAAKLLADMGAQVAITATGQRIHQRVAELRKAGHTARGYIADPTDRPAARSMVEAVEADFGKIDILVHNAGMTMEGFEEVSSEFARMTDKAWDLSIARNLTTCYNVTRRGEVPLPCSHQHAGRTVPRAQRRRLDHPDQGGRYAPAI